MSSNESHTVGIVGAGLVGCLAALAFANEGFKVELFESRPDLRDPDQQVLSQLRSINLAVSARGITALRSVDEEMADRVLKDLVPMHGRMVHDLNGKQICQKYGLYGECINSINRSLLNRSLLDELDKLDNVKVTFNHKLIRLDNLKRSSSDNLENAANSEVVRGHFVGTKTNESLTVENVNVWIGADGSYSQVRSQIQRALQMNFSQEYIDHYYLELRIPAKNETAKSSHFDSTCPEAVEVGTEAKFALNPNHLHIWPRHEYMLIALANSDGSFTCTLFAPKSLFDKELAISASDADVVSFFRTNFPSAIELMGDDLLLESFRKNPRGSLVCVKCSPYNVGGKAIIIGDAAHSMVPFYGQGMNCGFEDVRTLMAILKKHEFDFETGFNEYTETRRKDLGAIVDLSMRNYQEMRHDVTSTAYLLRKSVDGFLSRVMGDFWLPLYTMVSFRADIPYSRAVQERQWQNDILTWVIRASVGTSLLAGTALWHGRLFNTLSSLYSRLTR
ncbi:kynurenine 3-monooxygenase [Sugiyamaella lignohabitans]|uniref:Kynurenine 3-monooxygenase n=1 Tax=Sugiyamaella lignohabitans TaxID=796027 RepID=A0A161HI12_9ASCO|nr:kynurenine 3-monooxygenase [Sugiyamaella lignohabitans]ANB11977.1 kynurenine 3-monooxygenase [Sugiyamaella lignohabitans]